MEWVPGGSTYLDTCPQLSGQFILKAYSFYVTLVLTERVPENPVNFQLTL